MIRIMLMRGGDIFRIIILLGIISVFALLALYSRDSMAAKVKTVPHLFAYSEDYVLKFLQVKGYSNYYFESIRRNSKGTILYIDLVNKEKKIILSVSRGGKSTKIIPPTRRVYLNDKGDFVAWINDKREIHFKNGFVRTASMLGMVFGDFDIDPSGKYFFVKSAPSLIEVSSTDEPQNTLFQARIKAEKIFVKNEKIYLFGRNYQKIRGPGDYEQHEIVCQIYKKSGVKFELDDEIHIPRLSPRTSPFFAVDMDPWSDKVLVVDVRDVPFSSLTSWYLFDLKSKERINIGHISHYAFFLKENIF